MTLITFKKLYLIILLIFLKNVNEEDYFNEIIEGVSDNNDLVSAIKFEGSFELYIEEHAKIIIYVPGMRSLFYAYIDTMNSKTKSNYIEWIEIDYYTWDFFGVSDGT